MRTMIIAVAIAIGAIGCQEEPEPEPEYCEDTCDGCCENLEEILQSEGDVVRATSHCPTEYPEDCECGLWEDDETFEVHNCWSLTNIANRFGDE